MTKIITLTGAQGVGKTTLANAVSKKLRSDDYKIIDRYSGVTGSISREAKNKGFQINENTNFETQSYIAYRYMLADIETRKEAEMINADYVILDRSVLDVIPYVMGSPNMQHDEKYFLKTFVINHYVYHPTELYYVEPLGIIIEDQQYRSANLEFQNIIIKQFNNMLEHMKYSTIPNMSVDERVELLIKAIK